MRGNYSGTESQGEDEVGHLRILEAFKISFIWFSPLSNLSRTPPPQCCSNSLTRPGGRANEVGASVERERDGYGERGLEGERGTEVEGEQRGQAQWKWQ